MYTNSRTRHPKDLRNTNIKHKNRKIRNRKKDEVQFQTRKRNR